MPTHGAARYTLSGATAPTFGKGGTAPGSFSGQDLVQFGPGTGTRVALEGQLKFGNDQHYRMVTEVTVRMPGKDVHVEADEADLYAAIDALADKLDRQIQRYKEKLQNHRSQKADVN